MSDDFRKLFSETQVASLSDTKQARLVIEGLSEEELWITGLDGSVQPNYQLMYAIGAGAYLNAFSQRLSLFQLQGIHVVSTCDSDDTGKEPPFLTFYKENNIVLPDKDPIGITFNSITVTGWVVKMIIGEYSKDGIDGHTFQIMFLGLIDGIAVELTAAAASAAEGSAVSESISDPSPYGTLIGAIKKIGNTAETDVKSGRLIPPAFSTTPAPQTTIIVPKTEFVIPLEETEVVLPALP